MTHTEIQEELRRFNFLISGIREEGLRKDKLREHKNEVEKDFRNALESLHDSVFLPDHNGKTSVSTWSKKN